VRCPWFEAQPRETRLKILMNNKAVTTDVERVNCGSCKLYIVGAIRGKETP
jgi:hypothetical protein